jgi:HD superfamily phosphohydrolase YqeK
MAWIRESDFYTAPSSTKYHGSHEGGLLEHSLDVHDRICQLTDMFYDDGSIDNIEDESLAICALFHDVCKIGCYKTDMRWRKNSRNQWEQYPTFKFDEDFPFGGHGSKSVYLIQHFMDLYPEEAAAINCHMGAYDMSTYSKPSAAFSAYPLAWLLHVADEAATHIDNI